MDQLSAGRDLRTILDTKAYGSPCTAPEKLPPTRTPFAVRMRGNTYHCDGLFPWNDRQVFFFAPSIFSPSNCVRRHLTGSEMLKVLDFPDPLHEDLSSASHAELCKDVKLLPLKAVL
jgi:hypothetical protein